MKKPKRIMLKEGNGEKIQNESSLKVLSLSKLIKIFQAGAKLVNQAADTQGLSQTGRGRNLDFGILTGRFVKKLRV